MAGQRPGDSPGLSTLVPFQILGEVTARVTHHHRLDDLGCKTDYSSLILREDIHALRVTGLYSSPLPPQ